MPAKDKGTKLLTKATLTTSYFSPPHQPSHTTSAQTTLISSGPQSTIIPSLSQNNHTFTPEQQKSVFHTRSAKRIMADWGPVVIGLVLFVLLTPGLLFQIPGNNRTVEFGSFKTNGKAIAVHTLIFLTIYAILILAVHVHVYAG